MAVVEPLEERTFFTATVVGRHVFYNHSFFDRGHAAVGEADDVAIAPDKSALLPDQPITPDNYTGYSRGINGLMVDLAGLPSGGRLRAADFDFRVGNDASPSTWKPAPRPRRVIVRPLVGSEGVARATVTWRDRAIRNTWLRVTINADANTALAEPDVFYFGNLIGDTGDGGAVVDASDVELARSNLRQPAALQAPEDFDHNGLVTRADLRLARRNLGAPLYTAAPFTTGVGADFEPPALPGNWRLVFHDEFAHAALDPVWHPAQYWDHDLTVVGGDELEAYDPSGLSTSDGVLHLTARRDAQHGVPYVSGLVMTGGEKALPASPKFSFLYGYLEVRAKLPAGRGLWPAVWMMPASYNDDNGEPGGGFAFVDFDGQSVFDLDAADDLDPSRNRAGCYLIANDADAWRARMLDAGLPVTPIADQPWGMREFTLCDPSGNRVRIGRGSGDQQRSD